MLVDSPQLSVNKFVERPPSPSAVFATLPFDVKSSFPLKFFHFHVLLESIASSLPRALVSVS